MAKSEEKPRIECRAIIEILGRPKEHVEATLKGYIDTIKKSDDYEITKVDIAEPEAQETLFSAFADLEFSVAEFESLVTFCFDYMPSSIEIHRPEQILVKNIEISNLLNDLQARLHRLDMVIKKKEAENKLLSKNSTTLLKNVLILSLQASDKTIKDLSHYAGLTDQQLLPFLAVLIEEGKVKKEGNLYHLVKHA